MSDAPEAASNVSAQENQTTETGPADTTTDQQASSAPAPETGNNQENQVKSEQDAGESNEQKAQSTDVDMATHGKSPSGAVSGSTENQQNNDSTKPETVEKPEKLEDLNVDEDIDMEAKEKNTDAEDDDAGDAAAGDQGPKSQPLPQFTRKDKTLLEFLNSMDQYAPIIPDAVTDFYLAKSGFESSDRRIKRLLALATQKFISDIASDAYQYSRIRSASSISSSSNPQARAKALVAGMNGNAANANMTSGPNAAGQQAQPTAASGVSSNNQGKLVLTMEDLGSALAEYGLNIKRPDFYR